MSQDKPGSLKTFTMLEQVCYSYQLLVYPIVYTYVLYTGELIAHRERLNRHIQGTNTEVTNHKASITTLNDQLQAKVRLGDNGSVKLHLSVYSMNNS